MTRLFARCYSAWMPPNPPNLEVLVKALTAEHARFVVIGGFALVLHGGRTTTMDSDLAIATDTDNVSSVVRALAPLRPRPWNWYERWGSAWHPPEQAGPIFWAGVPFVWDEQSIRGSNVSLSTSAGDVDLLLELPGVDSFDGLLHRSLEKHLGGVGFRVASLDDLTAMKRLANRPQDAMHLLELERIRRVSEME
jgi:hypothetical protein